MIKIKVFCGVFFALAVFHTCANIAFAQTTVKTMTWNIGTWDSHELELTPTQRETRMRKLAETIQSEKIEIAFIQEFKGGPADMNSLMKRLQELNYSMYTDTVRYEMEKENSMMLLLLSRYPLDQSTKKVGSIRNNRNAQSIIVTNTPIGNFRLSNLHTHILDRCSNLESYLKFFFQFDKDNSLMGGDTNALLLDSNGTNSCRNFISSEIFNDIVTDCRDTSQCKREGIDWFLLPKNSKLYIQSMVNIGNIANISDQHPAIVAQIGSTNPPPQTSPPIATTCRLQGIKEVNGSIAPASSLLAKAKFSIDGVVRAESESQPFFTQVSKGAHTLTMQNPDENRYELGYTVCANITDCHTGIPIKSSTAQINCSEGYIDLWWHFIPKPTPSPVWIAPKLGDADKNGAVNIFDYNKVLQNFGRENCEVNLLGNCLVDIFDFNQVIAHFGS